ncbi:ABC transporter substrate-binding protein [Roseibium litorale]|uniref:ABC transporter substrate-binding protein n=1 Tax=Roseibium litorale TaxID=2803841 RepID=A0ABR9CUE0_9HYPH|nr:ABC transporter substrate-binding protein [Roseibium litorale]MBD8893892.1 ABC transporter substrate-binding protein [Roseibium litorale]
MLKSLLGTAAALLALGQVAFAIELTDVAGRKIELDKPAQTVVLGDGRVVTALALLDRDNPVARVEAILSDLQQNDPVLLSYLKEHYPKTAAIPMIKGVETGASAEAVIALKPDAAILSLSGHGPSITDTEFVEHLEAAGIKVFFIDFRQDPLNNTTASIELMGKVIGREQEAEEFSRFYNERKDRIVNRLAGYTGERPTVFLQAHIGRFECCVAMAHGMLGPFVEVAGGRNVSSEAVSSPVGRHMLEFLIGANPDIWIGTASGTQQEYEAGHPFAVLGMHVDEDLARRSARTAIDSAGIGILDAVRNGRAYTIWHGFYNSPFNIYALEVFAKWFHPDLFADIDPEATFAEVHRRFLPMDTKGLYSVRVAE